jgi:ribosome-associated toxin RatA of RatAB toxin-antitoxin module
VYTEHDVMIDAPAGVVYQVIADAEAWPQHFGPSIHVEQSTLDSSTERLTIWATANGDVKTWTSRRELGKDRIRFAQERSSPPVASMSGEWIIRAEDGKTRLTLTHEFEAVNPADPAELDWIIEATNRNSETELANIKALTESWARLDELVFTFEDSVVIQGRLDDVYDFLYQANQWPDRLPHVGQLELREDVPNIQHMSMETVTKDGSTHTTESVRVCFPSERIVYKQLVPPSLMTAHTGEWLFRQTSDGVEATSRHTVTVNEANIPNVLGKEATVATARDFIRKAAGGNSMATLTLAKNFVEAL